MRIVIAAVGRARAGPTRELFEHYRRRIGWPVALKEVEERRPLPPDRLKRREAELLQAAVPKGARLVALDEAGKALTSAQFADLIGRWRDDGARDLAFVIGGAEGLDERLRGRADLILRLGRMTWPHLLVRALLAEQLYRAQQILAGHPYHRRQ
ncbi:MAG: 23S rRNA (pseudouridine(1915)-N(3))-methyltransferase RlmH [Kiloniellales bacterium]